jgi:hypothetical protein
MQGRSGMRAIALLFAATTLAAVARAGDPDGTEMEFLWQVNRARSDPGAWGHENGLGTLLDAIAPQPPLAWNATLANSAQAKAQEFIDHDYFAHQSPVTGSPNQLIVGLFGYPLAGNTGFYFGPGCSPCVYGNSGNTGVESLATSFGPDGGLFASPIDAAWGLLGEICDVAGTPNSCGTNSHRNHLLGAAALTAPMIEAGTGHTVLVESAASTIHYWVFHTGFPVGSAAAMPQLLTGVVYADADQDSAYDAGEGLAGVTVEAGALSTTSNAAGGWSISVANGSYEVSCSGAGFQGTAHAADVVIADANRSVDCLSGEAAARVDFAPEADGSLGGIASTLALAALARRRRSPYPHDPWHTSRSRSRARTSPSSP